MSVVAQLPKEMGGAEGKVAYIDTEGTFRPERISQIAERFGVDPDSALENIAYARALNSEHQLELLNTLSKEFASGEYRLLIIDSIMNCFRVDYCGRGELADRQQKLNQFLMKLAHMAEGIYHGPLLKWSMLIAYSEFNVCVLMVRYPPQPKIKTMTIQAHTNSDKSGPERSWCQCVICRCGWQETSGRPHPCARLNNSCTPSERPRRRKSCQNTGLSWYVIIKLSDMASIEVLHRS